MIKTRQLLLENFDEEVQDKLRMRAEDSRSARSRHERLLMDLSATELADCATFDDDGFLLQRSPAGTADADAELMPLGRYELPRRSGDAHLYRLGHPLAEWVSSQAKTVPCRPPHRVRHGGYGAQISTLKSYRGQSGWLSVKLISVAALGQQEQHLIVSACTAAGAVLAEDDPEKLLRLPARQQPEGMFAAGPDTLQTDAESRGQAVLRAVNQRNLGYFGQEVSKLDSWADDLKLGLEQEIKAIDGEIKDVRRTAAVSPTLEEKLALQKRQRELEGRRNKLRRELFDRQDQVEAQRNELIAQLEIQLQQEVEETTLFTIEWELA
jgi:hypothetical protein